MRLSVAPVLALVLVGGCSSGEDAPADAPTIASAQQAQRFPDVLEAELTGSGDTFSLAVTVSSPYDTPDRYADGWRVLAPDGTVLGEHTLGHDHASEQPFTRKQTGLEIPDGVDTVTVQGRDLTNGYGGKTIDVPVTR